MISDSMTQNSLPKLTYSSTHDLLIELLQRDLGSPAAGLKLLDIPCGSGSLALRMGEVGFQVQCADIDSGNFQARDLPFALADLNRALPFADQSFDAVVSIAGLQRVCFAQVAVAEFYRILKPGGVLFLGVTHHASIKSRIRFLLYGTFPEVDQPSFHQTLAAPEANFRFPLTYVRVEHLLRKQGFRLEQTHCDCCRGGFFWAAMPVSLLARLAAGLKSLGARDSIYRRASSLRMLRAKAYIICARSNSSKRTG
jgi:SAM-dependent methyltransferase